ncbi:MAG TPA: PHP domain-containing protein [Deltaproteobacteria bacterium]|nr:PHP domain-containing protein [Deltaproteobacteria bacterium]HPR53834.1 PHP domain-containing protein [Deltaproteobacteria bacterium]HXK45966.1 PHP domain-containing protein [Deltaproteobacteria bacterium]
MYDLHIHTTHSSDGQYSPIDLFAMAKRKGLRGIAFTDHMDINAAAEGLLLAPGTGIRFFTGVEISTVFREQEYHLLLYGFRPEHTVLQGFLQDSCRVIWDRAVDALRIFTRMGFDIRKEDVAGWGFSVPTGVTLLNALLARNRNDRRLWEYLEGPKASSPYLNFYQDYAVNDIGGVVRSALPDLVETMRLFGDNGVLVLAHPGNAAMDFLKGLKDEGLMGIEAFSTHHDPRQTTRLLEAARSLDLWVSAGSDFHGELIKPLISIGGCPGQPDEGFIEVLAGLNA